MTTPTLVTIGAQHLSRRWRSAYASIYRYDLSAIRVGPEAWLVGSKSRPGVQYRTTLTSCTCLAGQRDQPCVHRAWALVAFGVVVEPTFDEVEVAA